MVKIFKQIFPILIFSILFSSCEKEIKLSRKRTNQTIVPGEWFNEKDSTAGLSIRKNKLGIFKKMQFSGNEIYTYSFVDSISKSGNIERVDKTFIILEGLIDTLKYEYSKPKDSLIKLKINNKEERFRWKRLTIFKK